MNKKANNQASKKENGRFYLINFHPTGESEASICFVIKGSASCTIASPLNALQMEASGSCNIKVLADGGR